MVILSAIIKNRLSTSRTWIVGYRKNEPSVVFKNHLIQDENHAINMVAKTLFFRIRWPVTSFAVVDKINASIEIRQKNLYKPGFNLFVTASVISEVIPEFKMAANIQYGSFEIADPQNL